MKTIDDIAKRRFLDNPELCPYCKYDELADRGGYLVIGGKTYHSFHVCLSCYTEWKQVWSLVAVKAETFLDEEEELGAGDK